MKISERGLRRVRVWVTLAMGSVTACALAWMIIATWCAVDGLPPTPAPTQRRAARHVVQGGPQAHTVEGRSWQAPQVAFASRPSLPFPPSTGAAVAAVGPFLFRDEWINNGGDDPHSLSKPPSFRTRTRSVQVGGRTLRCLSSWDSGRDVPLHRVLEVRQSDDSQVVEFRCRTDASWGRRDAIWELPDRLLWTAPPRRQRLDLLHTEQQVATHRAAWAVAVDALQQRSSTSAVLLTLTAIAAIVGVHGRRRAGPTGASPPALPYRVAPRAVVHVGSEPRRRRWVAWPWVWGAVLVGTFAWVEVQHARVAVFRSADNRVRPAAPSGALVRLVAPVPPQTLR